MRGIRLPIRGARLGHPGARLGHLRARVAAARELRDRYLEQVNAPGSRLQLEAAGKYDVSRQLEAGAAPTELRQMPARNLLEAA